MPNRKYNSRKSKCINVSEKEKRAFKIRSANTRKYQKEILQQNRKRDSSLGERVNKGIKSCARKEVRLISYRMRRARLSRMRQALIQKAAYRGTDSLDEFAKGRDHIGSNDPFEKKKDGAK